MFKAKRFNKSLSLSDNDKEVLIHLRQMAFLLERHLILGDISSEEYDRNMADIDNKLKELEKKYE